MKIPLQLSALLLALFIPARAEDPPWKKPERWVGQGPLAKAEKKTPAQLRAEKIIVPVIELKDAPVRTVLEFLSAKSRELDPEKRGVNMIAMLGIIREPLRPPPNPADIPVLDPAQPPPIPGLAPGAPPVPDQDRGPKITLSLKNIPLSEALQQVATLAGLGLRWDEHAAFLWEPEQVAKPGAAAPKPSKPRPAVKNNAGKPGERVIAIYAAQPVMPKVDFRETSVRAAIEFLVLKSKQLDPGVGMNLVLKLDDAARDPAPRVESLTLAATDMPMLDVMRYIAEMSGFDISLEERAFFITPAAKPAKR